MKKAIPWLAVLISFVILYFLSLENYLTFHMITELFTIIVAGAIFVITINSKDYFKNQYLVLLGITYLFIAIIDLFHTMTYTGMPIFTNLNYPANQLWIAARYYESIVLLLAFSYMYNKKVNTTRTYIINIIITVSILLSILWLEIFPVCYIDGEGLTQFKIISEYIISGILVLTLGTIYLRKKDFTNTQYIYLTLALISTIISELLFTFYISNYGISNLFGHYFKVLSFIFIYLLIIKEGLQDPYSIIFRELEENRVRLKEMAEKDVLTSLRNRRSMIEQLEIIWKQASRNKEIVSILMIDLDDFKLFNDEFGHIKGDKILTHVASTLQKDVFRPLDVIARYGGEEFLVALYNCNAEMARKKAQQMIENVQALEYKSKEGKLLTVSIGAATCTNPKETSYDDTILEADKQLYLVKDSGKNSVKSTTL